ncbi:MAG: short-chain dehydrogenase [Halobacteriovoraceae bacterium]|nr:short-chain dehydrogenase [Halobacteriovoraceae bacterium]|tara:strand:+ start:12339 stop:13124 length:786 start_codon:yes stop_codon:yes gene_type:complete
MTSKTWAIITGASSGIGTELARELAGLSYNLVIVARREERLNQLALELKSKYSVKVQVITLDLLKDGACERLYAETKDLNIEILINNAGFGLCKKFADTSMDSIKNIMKLNMEVPTELTRLYLKDMLKTGSGYICQIASIASYLPVPYYSVYGATKSYLRHFSNTLYYELKNTGVSHTVFNPGFTRTEFFDVAGQKLVFNQNIISQSSNTVAKRALKAMFRKKRSALSSFINWYTACVIGTFIPKTLIANFVLRDMKKTHE